MDQEGWMSFPTNAGSCPPAGCGLEYLTNLDQLLVHQISGGCSGNKFYVKNKFDEKVYMAEENNSCGCERTFDITAIDRYERQCIQMYRLIVCQCSWLPTDVEVFSPPGCLIGSICQEFTWCSPKFNLKNAAGDIVLYIKGPSSNACCTRDFDFKLLGSNGQTVVGNITKQWARRYRDLLTNKDNIGVTFPVDLDVSMKAVVLSACILINYTYYRPQYGG